MFKNYLKTALRHFSRNKGYVFINILGLSIGIAVSIVGFLYVINELSFDKFNENGDRIHRIAVDAMAGNTAIYQTFTPAIMAQTLYDEFPEIDKVTRIASWDDVQFEYHDKVFMEDNLFLVDSTFFEIFTFPVVHGQSKNLLNEPDCGVMTESTAKRYFGDADPINQVIRMDTTNIKIIAVVEDVPENSHFHFDIAISLISIDGYWNNPRWFANNFRTYFMLHENVDYKSVEDKLPGFTDKHLFNGSYSEVVAQGSRWELYLQPLYSIHLNSNLRGEFEANGRKEYVYIFLIVSIFILLIACINFINLATAKSGTRAKDVGIRKTIGASKKELVRQYLGESILTSMIALVIAVILVEVALSYFSAYESIHLGVPYFQNFYTIPALLIIGLLVGVMSGFYPALVMSSFKPVTVLRNQFVKGRKSPWFRNILVTFQFIISVFLIIGTFVIYSQLKLLQEEQLGFNKHDVITIENPSALGNNMQAFKQALFQLPFVKNSATCFRMPGERFVNLGIGAEDFDEGFTLNLTASDENLADVINLELVEGRFFSKEYGTDSAGIIINEEAVAVLGYDEPIGKMLNTWGEPPKYFNIIGVIRNINYESKHQKIQPMGITLFHDGWWMDPGVIAVRVTPGDYNEMISGINELWDSFSPGIPFSYSFFEEQYDQLYTNEAHTRKLFLLFSFLAIFIACLGLLGLASYIAQQKTKEIGIRKTYGASATTISLLMSKGFSLRVLIANIIAWPMAWMFFDHWLNNFAYRTDIKWWFFILAGIISLMFALFPVFQQELYLAPL